MEFFVSLRYLSGRKMGFVSLITIISIVGVALGAFALVVTLSVADGFQQEIINKATGSLPHGQIRRFHYRPIEDADSVESIVRKYPGVAATSLSLEGKSVVEFNDPSPSIAPMQDGVKVHCVNDSAEADITDLASMMVQGEWNLDSAISYKNRLNPSIVVGEELVKAFAGVLD